MTWVLSSFWFHPSHRTHVDQKMMRLCLMLAGLLVTLAIAEKTTPIEKTWPEKLKKELFADYDKTMRPCEETKATNVNFGLTILKFDLCEKAAVLTVNAWAKMIWEDKKMRWKPSDYNDVKSLHISPDELWIPDIVLYNSADSDIYQHSKTNSIVYNNGTVLWVPPTKYEATCKLDMRLWPFDRQSCKVVVGSWTHHVGQINLQLEKDWREDYMTQNDEWYLLKMDEERNSRKYACCVEEYVDITYTLTIQRRPETYKTLILTPALVVIVLSLATFLLPTNAGEKILLNLATMIIICITLYFISNRLPAIAYTPPLIVLYFGSCLLLVTLGFVESVLVIRMSRSCNNPLPPFIKSALSGWLGSVLFIGNQNAAKKDEEGQVQSAKGANEWGLFAAALDRIFLIAFALIYAFKFISFYLAITN